jgi:hypothetical protein
LPRSLSGSSKHAAHPGRVTQLVLMHGTTNFDNEGNVGFIGVSDHETGRFSDPLKKPPHVNGIAHGFKDET